MDWIGTEKRQFRVIIAQNAVADLEKPCILLDTKASFDTLTNPPSCNPAAWACSGELQRVREKLAIRSPVATPSRKCHEFG